MDNIFAAAHPGKLGDALYCLPLIRYIYNQTGMQCDFYTSDYCRPLKRLFEYQSCIRRVIIAENYTVARMDMGVQPYYIPIPQHEYAEVYQLGFRHIPDRPIHQYIAHSAGFDIPLAIEYEYPDVSYIHGEYICIAPRGYTDYTPLFEGIANKRRAVIIGGSNEYTGYGLNMTGIDMLHTASILSRAKGFVGLMSSQLVLANGFDIPRIAPHDGISWDMRHVITYHRNFYPIHPTTEDIIAILDNYRKDMV